MVVMGIFCGVHSATRGIGVSTGRSVFGVISGCISVIGAGVRDWGVAAAASSSNGTAAGGFACAEGCAAPPVGDHCSFGSFLCSLIVNVVKRRATGDSRMLGVWMRATAPSTAKPCINSEAMKKLGFVCGSVGVVNIEWIGEELKSVVTPARG
jgi:hypothetical protein